MKYELPSTELIVIEENNYLKFGEYLNDMQCDDTANKLSLDDLEYVKKLQQENKQLKEQVQDLQADYGTIAQIERDLYKEVIEEVKDRITIKLGRYINEKDYVIDDIALDELLQILEILKKEDIKSIVTKEQFESIK